MSVMRKKKSFKRKPINKRAGDVLAIFCSDLHISAKPPLWRTAEPDWEKAQSRPLELIKAIAQDNECPVFCCGDIFDKWNAPPEAINIALKYLPEGMYAIPGQHDLPNHNIDEIERSAFWTLVESGFIHYLSPLQNYIHICSDPPVNVMGFPYGSPITQRRRGGEEDDIISIAIAHQYVWRRGYNYMGAPSSQYIDHLVSKLGEWDMVLFGDNHHGFYETSNDTKIVNCGSVIRRKANEEDYDPSYWVLRKAAPESTHRIFLDREYFNTGEDMHLELSEGEEGELNAMDVSELMEELQKLEVDDTELDDFVKRFCHRTKRRKAVRRLLFESLRS